MTPSFFPFNAKQKCIKKEKIAKAISSGATSGILSQFIADLIFTLLLIGENILALDIIVSNYASYYAAVAAGIAGNYALLYTDYFSANILTVFVYAYVENFVNKLNDNTYEDIDSEQIIIDVIITTLLIAAIDKKSIESYIHQRNRLHNINDQIYPIRSDNEIIIVLIITSFYFSLKKVRNISTTN